MTRVCLEVGWQTGGNNLRRYGRTPCLDWSIGATIKKVQKLCSEDEEEEEDEDEEEDEPRTGIVCSSLGKPCRSDDLSRGRGGRWPGTDE